MNNHETENIFSEDEKIHEYSEKEIEETKRKLGELSFGEKIFLYDLDVIDPPPDGSFTDIYRFGAKGAPKAGEEVPNAQNAWFVGFDDEFMHVKFGSEPKDKNDFNGSVRLGKIRCQF